MPVRTQGFNAVLMKLGRLSDAPDGTALKMAAAATDMVKTHTLAGKDKYGRSLKRYSASYRSSMTRRGRKGRKVDLFDKGEMFRALMWKKRGSRGAVVFFNRAEENVKALTHNSGKKGSETVSAHKRKMKTAFGKKIKPITVNVRQHKRQVDLPKRPFFGLQKGERAALVNYLENEIRKVIKK